MENNPPILKLRMTLIEKLFNVFGILSFSGIMLFIILTWSSIPKRIPGHYNFAGEVTRWGGREELFILLGIGLLLWIVMTVMERFPHLYNYRNLTEANVEGQYINSRMLVNFLKNEIAILFSFTIWNSIRVARGFPSYMNTWALVIIILILIGTMTFFIARSAQLKKDAAND
ncbi:DUF1648 domain-containing protein [Oceanobacillus sp. CFH 90083]|uniref:DUF1648 domain-containing protein n=1 Tax=Oceanobacillus sp. CFH 90083 TaxID=2592336 RepID=UPI00128D5C8E|nr:DUF1648 domain-containing protein [Oceanobacillus sp. CFH 90083]